MRLLRLALARLRALFRRDVVAGEIREEMQFHLDMRAKEYQGRGAPADDARRAAMRRFGSVALMQDRGYDVRGGGVMETVLQDVRYGVRLLGRDRHFSIVAVGTMALAVGASTALFSVIDSALLRPLPYPKAEQLVDVTFRTRTKAGEWRGAMAPSQNDLRDWRTSGRVFTHLGQARVSAGRVIVDVTGPERVIQGRISADLLELFGVTPVLGRTVSVADTQPGAPAVVLLGHGYWRTRFDGDHGVLGRTIRVGGELTTIVGVLPAWFHRTTAVWQPMEVDPRAAHLRGSGTPTYGRLRPGLSLEQANQQLTELARAMAGGAEDSDNYAVQLRSLYSETVKAYGATIGTLSAAVAGILLIACLNVAGLLLARGTARQPELAVRASVGAGRSRLVRQLLTESVVLALLGGLGGIILAWLCLDALVVILPLTLPANSPPAINVQVLVFGAALSILTAMAFGLLPALRLSGVKIGFQLARANRRHGSALSRRGGQVLIAAEVALALVLLTGSGLMVRSFSRALAIDVGFDPRAFLTMEVFPADPDPAVRDRYFPELLNAIRSIPGVAAAGAIDWTPLGRGAMYTSVRAQGGDFVSAAVKFITPGYFEAIGLAPLQGRLPTDPTEASAVLSASAARRLFPEQSPIGRAINPRSRPTWQVTGVVRDIRSRDAFLADDDPDVYLVLQAGDTKSLVDSLTVVVRPAGPVAGLADNLRRAAHAVGPPVIVERIRSGRDWFSDNVETPRHQTLLLGLLAGLALTLTLVGIFGVTAYGVAARTQEVGLRMAFGAQPIDVVTRMVRDAAWPVLAGLGVGLASAYHATRAIETFLFETTPHDAVTFVAVAVLTALTALFAAWLPARRAARVDPVVALRAD
jgi:predicted permease